MSYETVTDESPLFCKQHPRVATALRCYQCDTPICPRCAQRTPVGYQCPSCKRGLKQRFEQARPLDYGIAVAVALILGSIAGVTVPLLGWLTIFFSPLAGTLIAQITWWLVKRHYSSHLWWIVAAGIIIGTLPHIAIRVAWITMAYSEGQVSDWIGLLWPLVHIGMAIGASSARLRLGS